MERLDRFLTNTGTGPAVGTLTSKPVPPSVRSTPPATTDRRWFLRGGTHRRPGKDYAKAVVRSDGYETVRFPNSTLW